MSALTGRRATGFGATAVLTAAVVSAVALPVVAGIAFLLSLAWRRPLIGVALRRWPWLTSATDSHGEVVADGRVINRLTAGWGLAMLLAGGLQALLALSAGVSVTDPSGLVARSLIALGAVGVMVVVTWAVMRREQAQQT